MYAEAVWSLYKRILREEPYNYDENTALEVVTRLTFIAAGNVKTWYSGNPPYGGCGSASGYREYIAADDDNGNINDGTPHMSAIFKAFNDQEIACNSLTVKDSGCAGTPNIAPQVSITSGNMRSYINWSAVSGATNYQVFRTEGLECGLGKVKLTTTKSLSYTDTGLMNGREYYYIVIAKGPSDSCFGPASPCTSITPIALPPTPRPSKKPSVRDFSSLHLVNTDTNYLSPCNVLLIMQQSLTMTSLESANNYNFRSNQHPSPRGCLHPNQPRNLQTHQPWTYLVGLNLWEMGSVGVPKMPTTIFSCKNTLYN